MCLHFFWCTFLIEMYILILAMLLQNWKTSILISFVRFYFTACQHYIWSRVMVCPLQNLQWLFLWFTKQWKNRIEGGGDKLLGTVRSKTISYGFSQVFPSWLLFISEYWNSNHGLFILVFIVYVELKCVLN